MSKTTRAFSALIVAVATLTACEESLTAPRMQDDYPGEFAPVRSTDPRPSGGVLMDGVHQPEIGLETAAPAYASDWGRADVVSFADPGYVVGESFIKREATQTVVRLSAGAIQPGVATTLWAVVFNNPESCVGECDDPDLFENPATRADLLYVAGAVANERGEVIYAGRMAEGAVDASIMPLFGLPAWGVIDSEEAEIHLVIRTHGPVVQGLRRAQTTTFNGGCTGFGSEFGAPGPNECVDLYFASHYAN